MWWGDKCKSGQQKEQGPSCTTAFCHRGSAPELIKVRVVTSPGGRNGKRADFQQEKSWDMLLPSGSKRLLRVCALLNNVLLLALLLPPI